MFWLQRDWRVLAAMCWCVMCASNTIHHSPLHSLLFNSFFILILHPHSFTLPNHLFINFFFIPLSSHLFIHSFIHSSSPDSLLHSSFPLSLCHSFTPLFTFLYQYLYTLMSYWLLC